ncbi:hypothetical protein J2S53_002038 [Actinopolyspora lacussalsi]|uniref:hypothetical protein n=1 Tax=Actinopolyspora righensis TaxID=995060 RepID=UPI001114227B|nr:hypothetical protein [Actinopolyspora righensis]MDP9642093.1 hypothetical protein [Actinopolyspora lacussalsi]
MTVVAVESYGVRVVTRDGVEGIVDKIKIPSWLASEELPGVGESLTVVVLDERRDRFRASLLDTDFEIAGMVRRGELDEEAYVHPADLAPEQLKGRLSFNDRDSGER